MGGTMRLGLYPCQLQQNTIAKAAYPTDLIEERHRHRFEFNNRRMNCQTPIPGCDILVV